MNYSEFCKEVEKIEIETPIPKEVLELYTRINILSELNRTTIITPEKQFKPILSKIRSIRIKIGKNIEKIKRR